MKSGVRKRGGQGEVMDCVIMGMGLDTGMGMDTTRATGMGVMGVRLSRDGGYVGI